MKYVILSNTDNIEPFIIPRQLLEVNGEPLIKRTIRLLKENGVKDILVTSHDKRFDNLGATRYEPIYNNWKPKEDTGYWVTAFTEELLIEPITFLFGDVYYSEKAIKTIVEAETRSILYFCTYQNKDPRYIKHHDEPLAFKVVDYNKFKEHIQKMKDFKDSGKAPREPIAWELYRSINNQPLTVHKMTDNYIAINDETCDVDRVEDIELIKAKIEGGNKMVKVKCIVDYNDLELNKLVTTKDDPYIVTNERADYLANERGLVEIIEVIPEDQPEEKPKAKPKTTFKKAKRK